MTLLWGVVAVVALSVLCFRFGRYLVGRRPRYFDSAAWSEEHWREQHERAKADQHRLGEGIWNP